MSLYREMTIQLKPNATTASEADVQILRVYFAMMPVCVFVGLLGNSLVWILIRSNRILNKLPSNIYLLALAVMSSSFLISLFVFWLEQSVLRTSITRHSILLCKCLNFLAHFCDFSSVWLIVLVGFERLILLYRAKRSMTKQRAQRHVCLLLLTALIFNSWVLLVAGLQKNGECDIDARFSRLYQLFTAMEIVLCMALPSVLIILSNVLVVIKLHSHLKRIPSSPTVSFNTADLVSAAAPSQSAKSAMLARVSIARLSSRFSLTSTNTNNNNNNGNNEPPPPRSHHSHSLRYADLQLTRSLLIVTSVFIALNLPSYAYRLAMTIFFNEEQPPSWMQRLGWAVHSALYLHHALLFYLYIFYSPQMKKRLLPTALKLLECYCFKPDVELQDQT